MNNKFFIGLVLSSLACSPAFAQPQRISPLDVGVPDEVQEVKALDARISSLAYTDPKAALPIANQAIQLSPRNGHLLLKRANIRYRLRDPEGAKQDLIEAISVYQSLGHDFGVKLAQATLERIQRSSEPTASPDLMRALERQSKTP